MPTSKDTLQLARAISVCQKAAKRRREAQATLSSVSRDHDSRNYELALRNLRNATAEEEQAGRALKTLRRELGLK